MMRNKLKRPVGFVLFYLEKTVKTAILSKQKKTDNSVQQEPYVNDKKING